VTTVTVTAGKPSEFAFTLSKSSNLAVGKVTFKVTNKGLIGHSFKVCTKPVAAATANTCVGVATKVLNKGQTATLTVTFKTKGKYEFLCTVSGHAANGMKGLVGAGVPVSKGEVTGKVTTTTKGTTTTGTTTTAKGACAAPATTTLTVNMVDYSFSGVPSSLPCGTVTVNEVNAGQQDHNISFQGSGVTGGIGPVIGPGANASFTMTINPGSFSYQCDVGDHAAQGMAGAVTVH
jgi:plastocyanin